MSEFDDLDWLSTQISQELDIRPKYSKKTEKKLLENATIIRNEKSEIIAYAELVNHLKGVEIGTVLVDPNHRGEGYGYNLLQLVLEKTDSNLVFLYTKSPALKAICTKLGFKRKGIPSVLSGISILLMKMPKRFLTTVFRADFKRLWVQTITLRQYHCYVLKRE